MNKLLDKIMPFVAISIVVLFLLLFLVPLIFLNGAS